VVTSSDESSSYRSFGVMGAGGGLVARWGGEAVGQVGATA
jgi:hypothetical protein